MLSVGAVARSVTVSFTRGPDEYFGDAVVSCEGGCGCAEERIVSRFKENSVRTMRQFFMQVDEPAPRCSLRFVAREARARGLPARRRVLPVKMKEDATIPRSGYQ